MALSIEDGAVFYVHQRLSVFCQLIKNEKPRFGLTPESGLSSN